MAEKIHPNRIDLVCASLTKPNTIGLFCTFLVTRCGVNLIIVCLVAGRALFRSITRKGRNERGAFLIFHSAIFPEFGIA